MYVVCVHVYSFNTRLASFCTHPHHAVRHTNATKTSMRKLGRLVRPQHVRTSMRSPRAFMHARSMGIVPHSACCTLTPAIVRCMQSLWHACTNYTNKDGNAADNGTPGEAPPDADEWFRTERNVVQQAMATMLSTLHQKYEHLLHTRSCYGVNTGHCGSMHVPGQC